MSEESEKVVKLQLDGAVLTVILNRPERHNALNASLVRRLTELFRTLTRRDDIRVVILTGAGRSFSAGADLKTIKDVSSHTYDLALLDGQSIFDLMKAVNECPLPVVGRVNGAALGGGMGLVSCCDITIAVDSAQFGFTESRLGLVPAVISPFVLPKIGVGWARELYLTGERFGAAFAQKIGLIHHIVHEESLDDKVMERVQQLLMAAPEAQVVAKRLLNQVPERSAAEARGYTTDLFARRWVSEEARERIQAYLETRNPEQQ